eukprot:CAMPEP_0117859782 /NCGR_PEP_ID=MMETSP0950-20121206/3366_1 /TAXON_ID=44440 /ORGANISM="Chattonella subsalsa, Strain CCMP2191" /LENGTH=933 /DNA_ID=CAMNT_0005709777 /DNA_START=1 /DNA_END=2802 /DNA_ORIENTATION=+
MHIPDDTSYSSFRQRNSDKEIPPSDEHLKVEYNYLSGSEKQERREPLKRYQFLNYAKDYADHWSCTEAIREIIQNWWDGLRSSHERVEDACEFEIIHTCRAKISSWNVYHAEYNQPLGYIRWFQDKRKLIVVNHNVQLNPSILITGHSAKRRNGKYVGGHGEGLNVALVRLTAEQKSIRYETSSTRWSFDFKIRRSYGVVEELRLKMTHLSAKPKVYQRKISDKKKPFHGFDPANDTRVTIMNVCENDFAPDNFLFLKPRIRHTACFVGELGKDGSSSILLDRCFSKRLFVKQREEEDLLFGYNFYDVILDRERKGMPNKLLRKKVADVWQKAIVCQTSATNSSQDVLPSSLFLEAVNDDGNNKSFEAQSLHFFEQPAIKNIYDQLVGIEGAGNGKKGFVVKKDCDYEKNSHVVKQCGYEPIIASDHLYDFFIEKKMMETVESIMRERKFLEKENSSKLDFSDPLRKFYMKILSDVVERVFKIGFDEIEWRSGEFVEIEGLCSGKKIFVSDDLVLAKKIHQKGAGDKTCWAKDATDDEMCICCVRAVLVFLCEPGSPGGGDWKKGMCCGEELGKKIEKQCLLQRPPCLDDEVSFEQSESSSSDSWYTPKRSRSLLQPEDKPVKKKRSAPEIYESDEDNVEKQEVINLIDEDDDEDQHVVPCQSPHFQHDDKVLKAYIPYEPQRICQSRGEAISPRERKSGSGQRYLVNDETIERHRLDFRQVPDMVMEKMLPDQKELEKNYVHKVEVRKVSNTNHLCYGQHGLFAKRTLNRNTTVGFYIGEVRCLSAADNRDFPWPRRDVTGHVIPDDNKYCFKLHEDKDYSVIIDAEKYGNHTRFINHWRGIANEPNCVFETIHEKWTGDPRVAVKVIKRIEENEELLLDYGPEYDQQLSEEQSQGQEELVKLHSSPTLQDMQPDTVTFEETGGYPSDIEIL